MFIKEEVPACLLSEMIRCNEQEAELLRKIKGVQETCQHKWEKVMFYDKNYSPRIDGQGIGADVIKEFVCTECNLHKPINGMPWQVCRKCGGNMKHDHREMIGQSDYAHIYKCESCGHEYDTT